MANYGSRRAPGRASMMGRRTKPIRRRRAVGGRGGRRTSFNRPVRNLRRPSKRSIRRAGFRGGRRTSAASISLGNNRSTWGGNPSNSWETSWKQNLAVHSDATPNTTSYKNRQDIHSDVGGPAGKSRTGLNR